MLDGGEAIYIERVEARRALRIPSAMGRGYPAHATNLGKVLLADLLPRGACAQIVAERGLAAYTPHTITDPEPWRPSSSASARSGYAVDNEEYDEGLRCIGAADPRPHRATWWPRSASAARSPASPRTGSATWPSWS